MLVLANLCDTVPAVPVLHRKSFGLQLPSSSSHGMETREIWTDDDQLVMRRVINTLYCLATSLGTSASLFSPALAWLTPRPRTLGHY